MLYVFLTILLTVYGQLVIKWKVVAAGGVPEQLNEKIIFLVKLLFNPWVISVFIAAFLAALSWMMAMSKLQLSYAYPFVGLSFALVLVCSHLFFYEPLTWPKLIGVVLIMLGIAISTYVGKGT